MTRLVLFAVAAAAVLGFAGCGPDKSIAFYNSGIDAANRDNYEEAARLFSLSVQHRPRDAEARYNLGLALIKLRRFGEAEVQLREAVSIDPMDPDSRALLGESLEKQGELAEAKSAYRAALNIRPTHVSALMGLAAIALAEGQNRAAQDYATEASDLDPNNLDANVLLSEAYFRNGDYSSAYGQILTAKRLKPADAPVLLLFGKIAYSRRMYADALGALGDARALGLSSDDLFLYLGLTNLALGTRDEAERNFRLAIFKNADNVRAWRGLAETYIGMKKWPDASEAIARASALDPESAETAIDRALIAMHTGDVDGAVRELEAAAARPGAPQITSYYLGHAYLRQGSNAKALAAFERFVAIWEGEGAIREEARAIVDRLTP
jgi:tetratricopeptide (TPR) repeat protein